MQGTAPVPRGVRVRLVFAGAGVLLGAADTYVVVVALPAIMASVGIDLAHLQQATPIISGFLIGYIAALPLLGRLSDIHGRGPVLTACLVLFASGSLLTASATSLAVLVAGRALQGAGGGGLVPVTLALVADLWPVRRRAVPLGMIAAAQELGSVVGPLYGAALTGAGSWRAIFYVNMPLAVMVAAGVRGPRTHHDDGGRATRVDGLGIALAAACAAAAILAIATPPALADSASIGAIFSPLAGDAYVTAPVTLVALAAAVLLVVRELTAGSDVRVLIPLRSMGRSWQRLDLLGGALIAGCLACVVVSFATADPRNEVVSGAAPALLPAAVILAALFALRELRIRHPLVDLRALRHPAAAGSLLASLAVGAALVAALVDVPVFARATVDPDSQVAAALVLARLLIAIPAGALLGGLLVRRLGYRVVGGAGMLLAALALASMALWSAGSLSDPLAGLGWLHPSDPVLVVCGLGFGLSVVPITAAMLGAVPSRIHGVAASLTVGARMVGMLAGLSLLTGIGLRRFYSVQSMLPSPASLCPRTPLACGAYARLETAAVIDELHAVFIGAAVCALIAAVTAVLTLRRDGGDSPVVL